MERSGICVQWSDLLCVLFKIHLGVPYIEFCVGRPIASFSVFTEDALFKVV
jgi:hypothetical protein